MDGTKILIDAAEYGELEAYRATGHTPGECTVAFEEVDQATKFLQAKIERAERMAKDLNVIYKQMQEITAELAAYRATRRTPEECAAALEELERKWTSVNDGLPDAETEVFVRCISSTGYETYTTALYEDGTINADESCWNWVDVEFYRNAETNEYMVPEGWWEYRHYNADDVYNNVIDDKVTHWMPITKKKQEGQK